MQHTDGRGAGETSFAVRVFKDRSCYYLPGLEKQGVVHGFFTKPSQTEPPFFEAEKRLLRDAFSLKDVIIMDQEHKDEVHVVVDGERPSVGDGILLVERNVAAVIKTADCLAVIVADPEYPMAAIVHAGWRGTVKKIAAKAAEKMVSMGARRKRMVALMGPSVRPCCYEVGDEVTEAFRREGFTDEIFRTVGDAVHLDLARANRELLLASGVHLIYDTGLCTLCNPDLFASYRRGDRSVRQISFVSLHR